MLEDIKQAADNKEKAIKVKCFLFVLYHKPYQVAMTKPTSLPCM